MSFWLSQIVNDDTVMRDGECAGGDVGDNCLIYPSTTLHIYNSIRDGEPDTVVDHFAPTAPISTYSLGFVISQFESVNGTLKDEENLKDFQEANSTDALGVHIYSRREFAETLGEAYDKVYRIQQILKRYLASPLPTSELKIVALPNVKLIKPADSWGLILMR